MVLGVGLVGHRAGSLGAPGRTLAIERLQPLPLAFG
jgi:hypothetical protein